MERVVELLRLLLVQRVRPAVLELVERERDRAAARERVDQERARRPERGGRQRQNAAEDHGVDRHRGRREAPAREHLRQQPAGRVPITAGFLSKALMISVVWSATCFSVYLASTSGFVRACSTVSGSSVGKRMPAALGRARRSSSVKVDPDRTSDG